jgi:hypothetical protein
LLSGQAAKRSAVVVPAGAGSLLDGRDEAFNAGQQQPTRWAGVDLVSPKSISSVLMTPHGIDDPVFQFR